MVPTKVNLAVSNRDEEVKSIDEENRKAWQVAVENELKKKCDELIPSIGKDKSRKASLKDAKKSSFKMGSKPLYAKTELGKAKKAPQTPIFKKDELKRSFK